MEGARKFTKLITTLVLCGLALGVQAEPLDPEWRITDQDQRPLAGAVVILEPVQGPMLTPAPQHQVMAQSQQAFLPDTLVIPRGTSVDFPNRDTVQHHVYSFSAAKTFELSLYAGDQHDPVLFEQTGIVALGCNIHDQMRGYIVVTDSPWFAQSAADGRALIRDVPAGEYRMRLWHPRARTEHPDQMLSLRDNGPYRLELQVNPPPEPVKRGLKAWVSKP